MKLRWRVGIIAGLFLAVFSLYPQFKMIYLRGTEWNGHYAYNDIDEVAYAAYLKALIDQDRSPRPLTVTDEIERLHKRHDEVLEFLRYLMVVQNATAERLSPGLVSEVQDIYRRQFGEAPNAR